MSDEERILKLLERWYDAERQGQTIPVEQLCTDCPELAYELRRQISVQRWLTDMATSDSAARLVETRAEISQPMPTVPGYADLVLLGSGGMGTVYRARDINLCREVALKVVRADSLTPMLLARLRLEAQAIANLDHQHIVKVYEVGTCTLPDQREVPFLALEFVNGGSLETKAGGTLAPQDAAHVIALVARAIDHAHSRGVVHRDLKPENILLAEPTNEPALNCALGCPKVTDFGLARRHADDRLTLPGGVVGTPAYMAPEQADGADVGPLADVYSLGTILYRLLAGTVPFSCGSVIDVLYHVKHSPPPPIRATHPEVPVELEAICLRCLMKRPEDRYGSAAALANDLRRWLDATTPQQPRKPRPRFLAVVLFAALVLVALFVFVLSQPRSDRPSAPELVWDDTPVRATIRIEASRASEGLIRLGEPNWRPLRAGDEVRVSVKLDRPGYAYVIWLDTDGEPGALYPWRNGIWRQQRVEMPVRELSLPEGREDEVYRMKSGSAGLETLLVLVRRSPLPESVDLAATLRGLGRRHTNDERLAEVSSFEVGPTAQDQERGPDLTATAISGDPILSLRQALRERLRGQFPYARAVTFGNLGSK